MGSCVSNVGYIAASALQSKSIIVKATVDSAIQVAIALWQRNSSKSIANMQDELADRNTKLAEKLHAHAKIFWPAEASFVSDMFGESKVTTQYVGLANGWAAMADTEIAAGRADWLRQMSDRCTPASRCENARWQRNGQIVRADTMSYAARQDEARTEILNDRRYARQYAALALGKGQVADLQTYQNIANTVGTSASQMLIGTVNSALTSFGFYSNKIDAGRWGSGTRDMLGVPSGATAPMRQKPEITMQSMPEQVRISPVSVEMLKTPDFSPSGKAGEWADLESDLRKMNEGRR